MFFGPLKETATEVVITDVRPTAFRAMLAYIYRGNVTLQSPNSAWQLWYAAKKYMLDSLEDKCRKVGFFPETVSRTALLVKKLNTYSST